MAEKTAFLPKTLPKPIFIVKNPWRKRPCSWRKRPLWRKRPFVARGEKDRGGKDHGGKDQRPN